MKIHLKKPGKPTNEAFEAQEIYMNRLIAKGVLPAANFDPPYDHPEFQTFLRSLVGFLNEELSESSEQLGYLIKRCEDGDLENIEELIRDYNDEISDVLAFFLELMYYANISQEDIHQQLDWVINEFNLPTAPVNYDLFTKLLEVCRAHFNTKQGNNESWKITAYHPGANLPEEDYRTNGARILGVGTNVEYYRSSLLDCYHLLNLSLNTLKNKPWKTKMVTGTNSDQFKAHVAMAFVEFFSMLAAMGFRPSQLVRNLLHKIQINHDRLDGKSST